MATIRIYDGERVLAFDLADLLSLLAPKTLECSWMVSAVNDGSDDLFWAVGDGADELQRLSREQKWVAGRELMAAAGKTEQVIWGEFVASSSKTMDDKWLTIRAIDSTFYEISTVDDDVLSKIKHTFKDVRDASGPWKPIP